MSTEQQLSHFSLISRLFGNLFYRAPMDPLLSNVFAWLQQKGLSQVWALDTDAQSEQALDALQMKIDLTLLEQEYSRLFGKANPLIKTAITDYGIVASDFIAFRKERGMPPFSEDEQSAVHFALVFLTASWIEDNLASVQAQRELFEHFLLPCANVFLAQVERQANLPFYRSLAILSREILAAMADELEEAEEE
ncbi:MAG: molecular chaperone [[Pasteurella] aerogenes]|nr:molecular chaperone [[Pasteurella] aerogenes]